MQVYHRCSSWFGDLGRGVGPFRTGLRELDRTLRGRFKHRSDAPRAVPATEARRRGGAAARRRGDAKTKREARIAKEAAKGSESAKRDTSVLRVRALERAAKHRSCFRKSEPGMNRVSPLLRAGERGVGTALGAPDYAKTEVRLRRSRYGARS